MVVNCVCAGPWEIGAHSSPRAHQEPDLTCAPLHVSLLPNCFFGDPPVSKVMKYNYLHFSHRFVQGCSGHVPVLTHT